MICPKVSGGASFKLGLAPNHILLASLYFYWKVKTFFTWQKGSIYIKWFWHLKKRNCYPVSHCYLEWYQLLRPHAKRHWGGMSRVSPAAWRGDLRRDWRPGSTQLATCGSHPLEEQRKPPGLARAMWTSSHQTEKAMRAAARDQTQPGRRAQAR